MHNDALCSDPAAGGEFQGESVAAAHVEREALLPVEVGFGRVSVGWNVLVETSMKLQPVTCPHLLVRRQLQRSGTASAVLERCLKVSSIVR